MVTVPDLTQGQHTHSTLKKLLFQAQEVGRIEEKCKKTAAETTWGLQTEQDAHSRKQGSFPRNGDKDLGQQTHRLSDQPGLNSELLWHQYKQTSSETRVRNVNNAICDIQKKQKSSEMHSYQSWWGSLMVISVVISDFHWRENNVISPRAAQQTLKPEAVISWWRGGASRGETPSAGGLAVKTDKYQGSRCH